MDKTTASVIFSIYGDNFDLNYVTKEIEINPTETMSKGVIPENRTRASIETSWCIGTEETLSYDINEQLSQLINLLSNKRSTLLLIQKNLDVKLSFLILVKVRNNETPAIYFDENTLEFINDIKATIDIDLYIC